MPVPRYVLREALLSAAINAAISIGFFLAVFGRGNTIAVWGIGNLAFDNLVQSFAVALMSALVPALLARLAQRKGKVGSPGAPVPGVGRVFARALAWAVAAAAAGGGSLAALLWLSGAEVLPALPLFFAKTLYGAALGAFVTSKVLTRQLS